MGRGSSGMGGGSGGGSSKAGAGANDFPEAFAPGKDFAAVGGVDHVNRTVSRTTQGEWDQYSATMNSGMTSADDQAIMRQFSSTPNGQGAYVTGYVRTQNAFFINSQLYDPQNSGKTDAQIFKRKADRDTVKALDNMINTHTTPSDGAYVRFSGPNGIAATFGLSQAQMSLLQRASSMTPAQLTQLNKALSGSVSYSKAYTSTSANRSLNAFSNPNAKQSKGFIFERKLNVPKGTKAFAPPKNAQESEVIFGRGMQTRLTGVSIGKDGHIVLHETFDGYK